MACYLCEGSGVYINHEGRLEYCDCKEKPEILSPFEDKSTQIIEHQRKKIVRTRKLLWMRKHEVKTIKEQNLELQLEVEAHCETERRLGKRVFTLTRRVDELQAEVLQWKKWYEQATGVPATKKQTCVFCHSEVDISEKENFEYLEDGGISCFPCYATESDTGE